MLWGVPVPADRTSSALRRTAAAWPKPSDRQRSGGRVTSSYLATHGKGTSQGGLREGELLPHAPIVPLHLRWQAAPRLVLLAPLGLIPALRLWGAAPVGSLGLGHPAQRRADHDLMRTLQGSGRNSTLARALWVVELSAG